MQAGLPAAWFSTDATHEDMVAQFTRLGETPDAFADRFTFDGSDAINTPYICRRLTSTKVGMPVVVDYLQMLDQRRTDPDLQTQISELKSLTRARGLVTLVISQVSRKFEEAQQALLASRYPALNVRWDRAAPGYCQHQKTWLVDAGQDDAVAIVGGINLNPHAVTLPGHAPSAAVPGSQFHDVYVEVAGPTTADVHHNFVQRWNGASEHSVADGTFGERAQELIMYPETLLPPGERSASRSSAPCAASCMQTPSRRPRLAIRRTGQTTNVPILFNISMPSTLHTTLSISKTSTLKTSRLLTHYARLSPATLRCWLYCPQIPTTATSHPRCSARGWHSMN